MKAFTVALNEKIETFKPLQKVIASLLIVDQRRQDTAAQTASHFRWNSVDDMPGAGDWTPVRRGDV
jgi:hypothetical protein